MEHILGHGWHVYPAGGATGEAYVAQTEGKKLFLKRNSSPFLAVLSAEGIVPKLVWTKRLENGDVITAQHWLNGRELKPVDMKNMNVAQLLSKIHGSTELLDMLKRIGKTELEPNMILADIENKLEESKVTNEVLKRAVLLLRESVAEVFHHQKVVCHADVNHNNWLLSDKNELFLIDWDGAIVADPALDLGMLLNWYIPETDWETWLQNYGVKLTKNLKIRMKWYTVSQTICMILWNKHRKKEEEVNRWLVYLQQFF